MSSKKIVINEKEKIVSCSDGSWLPMSFLLTNSPDYMKEWKLLYMKSSFTQDMFKKLVASVTKLYNVDLFDVIHESGKWQVYKNIKNDVMDFELELYFKFRKK